MAVLTRILAVCLPVLAWGWAYQRARRTIVERRVWLKEQFTGPQDVPPQLTPGEERLVVLLGRIRAQHAAITLYVWVALFAVVAPPFGPIRVIRPQRFALLVGAFVLVLALRLLYHTARAARAVAKDTDTPRPGTDSSDSSRRYLVEVDIVAVHDFNLPPKAGPFWSAEEVPKWLGSFGFRAAESGRWVASGLSLRHLHDREIVSLRPLDRDRLQG